MIQTEATYFTNLARELGHYIKCHKLDTFDRKLQAKLRNISGAERFGEMNRMEFESILSTLITNSQKV